MLFSVQSASETVGFMKTCSSHFSQLLETVGLCKHPPLSRVSSGYSGQNEHMLHSV